MDKITWCIQCHKDTNHFYDKYIPYEFHLRMVINVFDDFSHLLDNEIDYYTNQKKPTFDTLKSVCWEACWGHDLIEDTRTSYNDCKQYLSQGAADIIFAVSNEKGKTRAERANDKYYEGIRKTKGAVFVKLCDRIANVQYSKLTKSRMFEQYKKENEHFMTQLGLPESRLVVHEYDKMFNYLINLFETP